MICGAVLSIMRPGNSAGWMDWVV